jgi:hypothetical protein
MDQDNDLERDDFFDLERNSDIAEGNEKESEAISTHRRDDVSVIALRIYSLTLEICWPKNTVN